MLNSRDQITSEPGAESARGLKLFSSGKRRGTPQIITSLLFVFIYLVTAVIVVIAGLVALSDNEARVSEVLPFLRLNWLLIGGLLFYLCWRVWKVLISSSSGDSAPQLHRRFVMIFSLAALLPAILVGLFFGGLMNRDVNVWFENNVSDVKTVVEDARRVADQYLQREIIEMRPEVYAIVDDLNRTPELLKNRITFSAYLVNQAVFRKMPAIYVINSEGRILAKAESDSAPLYQIPTQEMFDTARAGSTTLSTRDEIDFLQALYRLEAYDDAYVLMGRYLDRGILLTNTRFDSVDNALLALAEGRKQINNTALYTYVQAALLILIAAVWLGLILANRIVKPLGQMVLAAEKVRSGDLSARVNVSGVWDEIFDLASAFNRMTQQLGAQRDDLIKEHDISETRRQFSEAVLSGVSAGVIGLSPKGRITLMNKSAETLLGQPSVRLIGQPIETALGPFASAYAKARESVDTIVEDQVEIEGASGMKNFDLRVSAYRGDREDTGWVMTFDDITRLVAAQRHSAWREVARRIAHEIKNPLTPIQLSAERLERKYAKQITDDPQTFHKLTQTIQRQVESLGSMVDEFSAFARMPAPILEPVNLERLLETTIFAQRVAFPEIQFRITRNASRDTQLICDERLITQALTNLIKNAGESVTARIDDNGLDDPNGRIDVLLEKKSDDVEISIVDNGRGWPLADKDRLFEPYVTTRESGTGLGLAIVKRIIEDHGGTLSLQDRPWTKDSDGQGAFVKITLPILKSATPITPSSRTPASHLKLKAE